mgnify:CR=1 FL=1
MSILCHSMVAIGLLLIFNVLQLFRRMHQKTMKKEKIRKGDESIKQRHLVCPANLMSERGHPRRRLQPYPCRAEEGGRVAHFI